jgi:hypothetical protein
MHYLARIGVTVLSVAMAASGDWSTALSGSCPRCVASTGERANAPVPIPQRAIVYSFVGEFASESRWWLIDLDTGQVILRRTSRDSSTTTMPFALDQTKLNDLRRIAVRTWHSRLPMRPAMAPGTTVDAYIVNGGQLSRFNPLEPADDFITKAVEGAICGAGSC